MNAPTELDAAECRAIEIAVLSAEFLRYAAMADLHKPCPIGDLVSDFRLGDPMLKRRQTASEVIGAEMDSGENLRRAIEILCAVAKGYSQGKQAEQLLKDMAERWADRHCEL